MRTWRAKQSLVSSLYVHLLFFSEQLNPISYIHTDTIRIVSAGSISSPGLFTRFSHHWRDESLPLAAENMLQENYKVNYAQK